MAPSKVKIYLFEVMDDPFKVTLEGVKIKLQRLSKKIKGGSHERPFITLLTFTTTNYLIYEKTLLTFSFLML